jgi:hypothetical protein
MATFHSRRRALWCATPMMRHTYYFGAPRLLFSMYLKFIQNLCIYTGFYTDISSNIVLSAMQFTQ